MRERIVTPEKFSEEDEQIIVGLFGGSYGSYILW
jgi:hypothetical protein